MKEHEKIADLTRKLLEEIGEDPKREGLVKTPSRVAKSWKFFSKVCKSWNFFPQDLQILDILIPYEKPGFCVQFPIKKI